MKVGLGSVAVRENIRTGPIEPILNLMLEATGGFEPPMGVLQTPALTTWPRRPVMVPRRGFEPLRPKARPPQDRVSTNSTTSAH
jgi:hypothetical protein